MKIALLILLSGLLVPTTLSSVRAQEEGAPEELPAQPQDIEEQELEEAPGEAPVRPERPLAEPVEEEHGDVRDLDAKETFEIPEKEDVLDEAVQHPAALVPPPEAMAPREPNVSAPAPRRPETRTSRDAGRQPSPPAPRPRSRSGDRDGGNRPAPRREESARPAPSGSGSQFLTFKIITDRNIFDSTRSARSARPRIENRRPNQPAETITLVGTLSYEAVAYAFFDGSRSESKKALEAGGQIAGYTVKDIGPDQVRLEADGKVIELPVGGQMRRSENGWQVVSSSLPRPTADAPATDSSSSDSSADDESDIIKRLMEKRAKEMER